MRIICDGEGKEALVALLNLALQVGGYKNLPVVNAVNDAIEDVPKIAVEEPNNP